MKRPLIDVHAHVFPDAIAKRAMERITNTTHVMENGGLTPLTDGTLKQTDALMKTWDVDCYVLQNIATRPEQQTTINNYAASLQTAKRLCFGSVHPGAEDAVRELERIKALGVKGVKLHPDYQGFYLDEPRLNVIYDAMQELELIAFFHTGYDPVSPHELHSSPASIAAVHKRFPRMKLVAAHLGGICERPLEAGALYQEDVYLDISMAPMRISLEEYEALLRAHGISRILLASDCPWGDIPSGLERLEKIGLTDREMDLVCHQNAAQLLGIRSESLCE